MFASVSSAVSDAYPAEAIRFARDEAARDADDVAAFLAEAELAPAPGGTRSIPRGTLLDLAAFVRLRRWEGAGHTVHLDAGLPTASAVLAHIGRALVAAAATPDRPLAGTFHQAAWALAVDRFAWAARPELDADVALDIGSEDELVEALAQFLWAHRHDAPTSTAEVPTP